MKEITTAQQANLTINIHYLGPKTFSEKGAQQLELILQKYLPELLNVILTIVLVPHSVHQKVDAAIMKNSNNETDIHLGLVPFSNDGEDGYIAKAAHNILNQHYIQTSFAVPVRVEQYAAVHIDNSKLIDDNDTPDLIASHLAALTQAKTYIERQGWENVQTLETMKTADSLYMVNSEPSRKIVGIGPKDTAKELKLHTSPEAVAISTTRMVVIGKNLPENLSRSLEDITEQENKAKLTNIVITNLKFSPGQPGQLHDLLEILASYNVDIRYVQLNEDLKQSYITCTVSTDKIPYVESYLARYNFKRHMNNSTYIAQALEAINRNIDENHPELIISNEDRKLEIDQVVAKMTSDSTFRDKIEKRNQIHSKLMKESRKRGELGLEQLVIHTIPVIGETSAETGDVYHQPENINTKDIIYQILSEEILGDNIVLTLNVPDVQRSLLELTARFKNANINLEDLVIKVLGNENAGIAIVKFKNVANSVETIKFSLGANTY